VTWKFVFPGRATAAARPGDRAGREGRAGREEGPTESTRSRLASRTREPGERIFFLSAVAVAPAGPSSKTMRCRGGGKLSILPARNNATTTG
jgi:hypothetical protein